MSNDATTEPVPETRNASEAVKALTAETMRRIGQEIASLGALALRDAGLDSADGWRYDIERHHYVRQS
jgi:hypothetical protein